MSELFEKYSELHRPPSSEAHGWLQWKGTDVCMDFHCKCGHQTHLDCDFTYYIECGKCHRVYWPNAYVWMTELTADEAASVADETKVTELRK